MDDIPVELTFMRLGDRHHELVLVHNLAKTYRDRPGLFEEELDGTPSFHHMAFECGNWADRLVILERLKARGDVRLCALAGFAVVVRSALKRALGRE